MLALCFVAVLLAIILLLMDAYLVRDKACIPLEREASLKVAISEEELRYEMKRQLWIHKHLEANPQSARIMATQWRR